MTRRFRMCVVDGCGRRVSTSQMVCKDHEGTAVGVTMSREVVKLEREVRSLMVAESEAERIKAAQRFQQRIKRGEFAALFTERFRTLLLAGAAEPLDLELGALRMALMRLMLEEQDPSKMATALSKVANSAANVKKTQLHLSTERDETEAEVKALHEQFVQWSSWREDVLSRREATVDGREEGVEEAARALEEREQTVKQLEARAAGAERRASEAEWRTSEAETRLAKVREEEVQVRQEQEGRNVARGWG